MAVTVAVFGSRLVAVPVAVFIIVVVTLAMADPIAAAMPVLVLHDRDLTSLAGASAGLALRSAARDPTR